MDLSDQLGQKLLLLPLWYVVFLLSVTCHEAAHAFAAFRGGDPTAYHGGQVSLNPIPHVSREPFGTILVPLLSYLYFCPGWMIGWASAPYDPFWEERHPKRAAAMAAAGPLANLLLAVLAFVVLKFGLSLDVWKPGYLVIPEGQGIPFDRVVAAASASAGMEGLGRLCSIALALNLLLFLFNLIPLPPMDGSSVVSGLSPTVRAWISSLRSAPMGGWIGILAAVVVLWRAFPPLYGWVLHLLWS